MNLEEVFGDKEKLNDFYTKLSAIGEMVRNPYANHLLPLIEATTVEMLGKHKKSVEMLMAAYKEPEVQGNPDEVKEEDKTMPGNS